MQLRNVCLTLFLIAFAATLQGCSDSFKLVPVSGQVTTEDGKPLDKIFVEFFPLSGGPKSMGETDSEGKFLLKTAEGQDGAVIGEHQVSLRDTGILGDKFMGRAGENVDMTKGRKPRIAAKYAQSDKSGLTYKVAAGTEGPVFKAAEK